MSTVLRVSAIGFAVAMGLAAAGGAVAQAAPSAPQPKQYHRIKVNLGPVKDNAPDEIFLDSAIGRILVVDPLIGQVRVLDSAGRQIQSLHYAPPGDGGNLAVGPDQKLYEAGRHRVLVRSEKTLRVESRIPLPAGVRQGLETEIGLAANRIWVGVIHRGDVHDDTISTPLAHPGRWTASYTGDEAALDSGVQAATVSSPYTVSMSNPPVIGHVHGSQSDGIGLHRRLDGAYVGGGVVDAQGNLWLSSFWGGGQYQPATCGDIEINEAHPTKIVLRLVDPLCGGPAAVSPSGTTLALASPGVLQFVQPAHPKKSLTLLTATTPRSPTPQVTATAISHDGSKLAYTSYNVYPHGHQGVNLTLSIVNLGLRSWH